MLISGPIQFATATKTEGKSGSIQLLKALSLSLLCPLILSCVPLFLFPLGWRLAWPLSLLISSLSLLLMFFKLRNVISLPNRTFVGITCIYLSLFCQASISHFFLALVELEGMPEPSPENKVTPASLQTIFVQKMKGNLIRISALGWSTYFYPDLELRLSSKQENASEINVELVQKLTNNEMRVHGDRYECHLDLPVNAKISSIRVIGTDLDSGAAASLPGPSKPKGKVIDVGSIMRVSEAIENKQILSFKYNDTVKTFAPMVFGVPSWGDCDQAICGFEFLDNGVIHVERYCLSKVRDLKALKANFNPTPGQEKEFAGSALTRMTYKLCSR